MKLRTILSTALSVVSLASLAAPSDWGAADTVACYNVGPGIEYTKIIYHDRPLIMWYTTIDLTNPLNRVEQVMSRNQVPDVGRWDIETYYRECSRPNHQVKVAWNHDFFVYDQGICIGPNVSNGQLTNLLSGRSMLAITEDRKAEIFQASFDCRVIAPDGTSVGIDVYNSGALGVSGDCVFFNNLNSLTLTEAGTYIKVRPLAEWKVNGANIPCEVIEVAATPLQTSDTECVIWLRGAKTNLLDGHVKAGDKVEIQQTFGNTVWGTAPQNIVNAFHGYPSIAHDGKLHEGEYDNFEGGREYEKSSHVMAGLSKDKTKLYICLNEMSVQSKEIDCVDMATWMLERGAWDIVNFDSGGSAAIALHGKMQNLPGRGSVRPVQDAMVAVSLAPDDNAVAWLGFTKKRISPSTISSEPLTVVSYNQYGDILEENVSGCRFTVVPESLGTVDSEGVFHTGAVGGAGKIIVEKDGKRGEMEVISRTATDIRLGYPSLLIDGTRNYLIPVYGTISGATYALNANAFTWRVADPTVAEVTADGIIKGLKEGKTTVSGTFEDVTLAFDVTVEIGQGYLPVYDFTKLPNDENATLKGMSNLTLQSSLPEGWTDGAAFKADISGRLRSISVDMPETLYGLPSGIRLPIYNPTGNVTRFTLSCRDNFGERHLFDVDGITAGDKVWSFEFADEDGVLFDVPQFPIKLETLTLYFDKGTGAEFAFGDLSAYYPDSGGSSVETLLSPDDVTVYCAGDNLAVEFDAASEGKAEMTVYSANGVKVLSESMAVSAGPNRFDANTVWLSDGIYICMLQVDGRYVTKKFIKR